MEEGIYLFGGLDQNNKERNELLIIKPTKKGIAITKPNVPGMPPRARFGHQMTYDSTQGILVIFGGRNDGLFESLNVSSLNDMCVLNLKFLVWCQVRLSSPLPPCYSSAYFLHDSALYFFGGVNDENYLENQV